MFCMELRIFSTKYRHHHPQICILIHVNKTCIVQLGFRIFAGWQKCRGYWRKFSWCSPIGQSLVDFSAIGENLADFRELIYNSTKVAHMPHE
jgi:hypothetical protein